MENYKLVLPEHLNHYGYLFGGNLLQWADETAWIAASLDYPGCNFVTIAMDKVEFRKSVKQGAILRIDANKSRQGNTSVQYTVNVFSGDTRAASKEAIFSTNVTFVRMDEQGRKKRLPSNEGND
jgi:acyl-CoA hydrolase